MRILVDTNVLFDVLTVREPFFNASASVWNMAERSAVNGLVSAISFNNVHYVVRRRAGRRKADQAIRLLRDIFVVVPLDLQILSQAIDAGFSDFGDAIQFFSAVRSDVDYLVTRNTKHFPEQDVPSLTPDGFLALCQAPD